jgi:hypothetical protein
VFSLRSNFAISVSLRSISCFFVGRYFARLHDSLKILGSIARLRPAWSTLFHFAFGLANFMIHFVTQVRARYARRRFTLLRSSSNIKLPYMFSAETLVDLLAHHRSKESRPFPWLRDLVGNSYSP